MTCALDAMTSALDEMVKVSASMIFAVGGMTVFTSNLEADFHDINTENLVHDHKSKESMLKSQNEGWNLGGHPRLPY